jgi:HAMP domain-containing protein
MNVVQAVLVAAGVLVGLYVLVRLGQRVRRSAREKAGPDTPTWYKIGGDEWLLEDIDRTVDSLVVRVGELEKQRPAPGSAPEPADLPAPGAGRRDEVDEVRRAVGELRERISRLEQRLEEVERWPGERP